MSNEFAQEYCIRNANSKRKYLHADIPIKAYADLCYLQLAMRGPVTQTHLLAIQGVRGNAFPVMRGNIFSPFDEMTSGRVPTRAQQT
ncbi:MAG TPA: hypothetical protein VIJ01_00520 [Candidatus Angelobacter sp.]